MSLRVGDRWVGDGVRRLWAARTFETPVRGAAAGRAQIPSGLRQASAADYPGTVPWNHRGDIEDGPTIQSCDIMRLSKPVSYTHLRAHETDSYLVCRLLLEKKKKHKKKYIHSL